jgi:hypothetical protein
MTQRITVKDGPSGLDQLIQRWRASCSEIERTCDGGDYERVLELVAEREDLLEQLLQLPELKTDEIGVHLAKEEQGFQARMNGRFESLGKELRLSRKMAAGLRKYHDI